jgi:signal transduction histidine kinase
LRFEKRSSIRPTGGVLIAGVAAAALVAVLGLALDSVWVALGALAVAIALAALLAQHLLQSERARHELVEAERARLSDQLISAEQEERRRIALFLHDVPVQAMSGIALMLDGVMDAVERGADEDAKRVLRMALARQRETIRELRDLSFSGTRASPPLWPRSPSRSASRTKCRSTST